MGLRCSLLGHDYGETTTEREREEQGGEVVVVERELQECSRCGSEKVLSENTEVRTLQASPETDEPESAAPQPETAEPSFSEPAESSVSTGVDSATASTPAEHAPSADEDDAVILEDESSEDREPGKWPDEAQQEAMTETADTGEPEPEPTPWPDQAGEDEGFDAKPASETEDEGDDAFEFGGGLTPESAEPGEAGDEGYVEAPTETEPPADFSSDTESGLAVDAETTSPPESSQPESSQPESSQPESATESDEAFEDSGFTSAGPVNPPSGSTDDSDTLLVCPECGFERKAARASLRAGDICPECRKGYLAERR